jgi:hypothetical protein
LNQFPNVDLGAIIKKGPKIGDEKEEFYDHSMLPVQVIKELPLKTERG